ncbi:MAG: hypothetical protein ABSE18_03980 [Minisyncoccia bacterium]
MPHTTGVEHLFSFAGVGDEIAVFFIWPGVVDVLAVYVRGAVGDVEGLLWCFSEKFSELLKEWLFEIEIDVERESVPIV